jgi:hypothetical protein
MRARKQGKQASAPLLPASTPVTVSPVSLDEALVAGFGEGKFLK